MKSINKIVSDKIKNGDLIDSYSMKEIEELSRQVSAKYNKMADYTSEADGNTLNKNLKFKKAVKLFEPMLGHFDMNVEVPISVFIGIELDSRKRSEKSILKNLKGLISCSSVDYNDIDKAVLKNTIFFKELAEKIVNINSLVVEISKETDISKDAVIDFIYDNAGHY